MKSRLLLLVIALSLSPRATAQNYDFSAATAQLQNNLNLYGGRVLAIVEQETLGEVFRYQAGAITQESKFGIASASKWLSGAVVLACVERGYFQLDDRIGNYLPIFDTYGKGNITIRQCFGMNSGLSLDSPDYEIDTSLTLAQSVNLIAVNTPVVFTPGTQLDYEGDGMQVVGRICEVASGKGWRVLASEVLFTPLGMTSTDYFFFGLNNPGIPGGARSTAADYLKFLRMIMNNGQGDNGRVVLSSRSVQEFFTNQTFGLPEYSSPWGPSLYYPYAQRPDYGMGSWIMAQHPTTGVAEEVGSAGAFGSYPWVDRKRGLRGIIFMYAANGYVSTYNNNLIVQQRIREEVDTQGLPPVGLASEIALSVVDGYLRLGWTGGGTLETSTNLRSWTVLPWSRSPFLESLPRPSAPALFYRVRR
jgi:CubicO group peptidase (beta-lactamase class C family)